MTKHTVDLGAFKLEVEEGKFVGDLAETKNMVQEARNKLAQVLAWGITRKDQNNFKLCMRTYFRVPADAQDGVYNSAARAIMDNLQEPNIAIQSSDLLLSPVVQCAQTSDAAAYVMRSMPDALKEAIFTPNPAIRASFYGALFMRFDRLRPVGTAAGNLIHEATHRFLGTRDWAYAINFDMIDYETTYNAMNMRPPAPPKSVNSIKAWYDMTMPEALNNTDSYAGFVMHLHCV